MLFAMFMLLAIVRVEAQYKIVPVNNHHMVVEWESEPRTRITFGDTASEIRVLDRERYLIRTQRSAGWILVTDKGQVLRTTNFTSPHQFWQIKRLFTAEAGWRESGQNLYEIWDRDGKKTVDQVFHEVSVDDEKRDRILCRRGNTAYILDTFGLILETRTLYRVGEPLVDNGFLGRWKWRNSRSHDYAIFDALESDSLVVSEPDWSVNHRTDTTESPIDGRLSITVDHTTSLLFAGIAKASTVTIRNVSPDPVRLSAFAGHVPIRYEVLSEENAWVRVDDDDHGYCGNSGGYRDLAAGYSVTIMIPVFKGPTPTRFRCRMDYRDLKGRTAELISDEWEGTFNFGESEWPWRGGRYGWLQQFVD